MEQFESIYSRLIRWTVSTFKRELQRMKQHRMGFFEDWRPILRLTQRPHKCFDQESGLVCGAATPCKWPGKYNLVACGSWSWSWTQTQLKLLSKNRAVKKLFLVIDFLSPTSKVQIFGCLWFLGINFWYKIRPRLYLRRAVKIATRLFYGDSRRKNSQSAIFTATVAVKIARSLYLRNYDDAL